jgi:hypothetical protein
MPRCLIAILLLATTFVLYARSARAEFTSARVPILPAIVPSLPRTVFAAAAPAAPATPKSGVAASMSADLKPVDNRFLGQVSRLLDGMRPPPAGGPRDAASRNPTLRDPQRERDATSWGIRTAPMSAGGAAFVGAGLGAAGAQFIDLAKVAKKLPVAFLPTMCQGGGGVALKARW